MTMTCPECSREFTGAFASQSRAAHMRSHKRKVGRQRKQISFEPVNPLPGRTELLKQAIAMIDTRLGDIAKRSAELQALLTEQGTLERERDIYVEALGRAENLAADCAVLSEVGA